MPYNAHLRLRNVLTLFSVRQENVLPFSGILQIECHFLISRVYGSSQHCRPQQDFSERITVPILGSIS